MLTVIYLLFVLPISILFIIGFFSYKPAQSKALGESAEANGTIIPTELLQQLQKANYIDANGKLKILNFVLDFMTHSTS
jgi:hypothetical protein